MFCKNSPKSFYGGISGRLNIESEILCCKSLIDKTEFTSVKDKLTASSSAPTNYFCIGGIVGSLPTKTNYVYKHSITNCYSSIDSIETRNVDNTKVELLYGGVGSYYNLSDINVNIDELANFDNNDVQMLTDKIITRVHDGNEEFSSKQMQTSAFLDYLNMYSSLNMDGPVWAQPAGGGYPYIAALYPSEEPGLENILKGDVNEDEKVNGTDLVALTNIILGKNPEKAAADVNGDKKVNGTDYVALANIILGKTASRRAKKTAGAMGLSIEEFDIKAGETKEMVIDLSNPEDEITLVQFDLRLPAGLSLKQTGGEYDFDIAGCTTWRKHSLDANAQADGTIRFLLASSSNTVLDGKAGAIIKMTLVADNSYRDDVISLENILLVTPNEKENTPANVEFQPTGITDVVQDSSKRASVFSLSGQRLAAPKKGLNIVGGRKVVVK